MTQNTKHLKHYDKIQCMSGGQELGQKNFGKLLSQITGETFCESDLTTIILIPCVILGALVLIRQRSTSYTKIFQCQKIMASKIWHWNFGIENLATSYKLLRLCETKILF